MMNDKSRLRLPAEWEAQDAVLIAWPHELTDWNYMLEQVRACYTELGHAISKYAKLIVVAPDCCEARRALADLDKSDVYFCEIDTNDTWTRDYGAIITSDDDGFFSVNDFKFNGWGLKFASNFDNLVNSKLSGQDLWRGAYSNRLGFVLEGGSIESDGVSTIMTTSKCLLSPNRNGDLSKNEIEEKLHLYLGADRVLWLDHGALEGDDTDSHIDTLARFVAEDTIMYVKCDDPGDCHFAELEAMEKEILSFRQENGLPYNCLALPLPDPVYDENGERLPATYANFLILNDAVLMPIYNQPRKDELAVKMMKVVFPDHDIVQIDCSALIRQHGSLHCATMQFPKGSVRI